MPIYEYECANCEHQFELLQKVSEQPATECPQCDKPQVKRLVSATSFRLKGSGWYETDFKDKPKKKETQLDNKASKDKSNSSPSPDKSKSSDSSNSSTSTKPAKEKSN